MKSQLEVLSLVLTELKIEPSIQTVEQRLKIQKAIYLVQTTGVDLGYAYNWYVRGPYSPSLTQDYYDLDALRSAGGKAARVSKQLQASVKKSLSHVRTLLTPPAQFSLSDVAWAELVASVHYLRQVEKLSDDDVDARIRAAKPWLSEHTRKALRVLDTKK